MYQNDTFQTGDNHLHEVLAAQPEEDPQYEPPTQTEPQKIRLRRYE